MICLTHNNTNLRIEEPFLLAPCKSLVVFRDQKKEKGLFIS